jgi:Fe-Mn family superoxide dismutase
MPRHGSKLANTLAEAFGSVDQWTVAFQAVAAMRGVGWVILFHDAVTGRLSNHWISLHQTGVPAGFKPLLVMDVWEHAFMRDYRATERGRYIEAFFRNIDWQMVERRFEENIAIRPATAA